MRSRFFAAVSLPVVLFACRQQNPDQITLAEAQDAVDESNVSSQSESVATDAVEIHTSFTIGGAVEHAASELRDWIGSQLPCADVTLSTNHVHTVLGAHGACTWHGHPFSGTIDVTVAKNDAGEVVVTHVWSGLSNGKVEVDGTATVTWNLADPSRHVVHDLTWRRLSDGRSGTGHGDRVQRPLPEGIATGFQVDGSRTWTGARGEWDLGISGVQMRWIDPCPQAGTYTLRTPKGHTLSLSFAREDVDTIRVTASSGSITFSYLVTSVGAISGS